MTQIATPIFSANEFSIANLLIKKHIEHCRPIVSARQLNNELAILEGFVQNIYNRTLVRYNHKFTLVGTHYYLPDLARKLRDNKHYITKPLVIRKINKQMQAITIYQYPKIELGIMNIQDPQHVLDNITNLISDLISFSPDYINTVVMHDTRCCFNAVKNFEELTPANFKHLYQHYIRATK